jgi:hypothetical protein
MQVLEDLRGHDSSNCYCADCGSENPDWCSINLGIILCIGKEAQGI